MHAQRSVRVVSCFLQGASRPRALHPRSLLVLLVVLILLHDEEDIPERQKGERHAKVSQCDDGVASDVLYYVMCIAVALNGRAN